MQNGDEASPSIILDSQGLLVKMLITVEPHGIFIQMLHTYTFKHYVKRILIFTVKNYFECTY